MRLVVVIPLVALLAACATPQQRVAGQKETYVDAAASPLYDVNVLRTKVPAVLIAAEATPYYLPKPLTCTTVASEIALLDDALGPDLDIPPSLDNPSALQRSTDFAKDGSVSLLRSGAQSLVPFRGWVRRLSGAERSDRLVLEAVTAGGVRRAFLKGVGLQMKCPVPASPSKPAIDGVDLDPPPQPREPQYPIR